MRQKSNIPSKAFLPILTVLPSSNNIEGRWKSSVDGTLLGQKLSEHWNVDGWNTFRNDSTWQNGVAPKVKDCLLSASVATEGQSEVGMKCHEIH